jgi:hypothetical protein
LDFLWQELPLEKEEQGKSQPSLRSDHGLFKMIRSSHLTSTFPFVPHFNETSPYTSDVILKKKKKHLLLQYQTLTNLPSESQALFL